MRLHWLVFGGILACGLGTLYNFNGMQPEYLFTGVSFIMLLAAEFILDKMEMMVDSIDKTVTE